MSPFQRNSPYFALVTLSFAGLVAIAFGALCLENRHALAAALLGAKFFLGLPIDRVDSYKLLAVSAASVEGCLIGIAMVVTGIVLSVSRVAKERGVSTTTAATASPSSGKSS